MKAHAVNKCVHNFGVTAHDMNVGPVGTFDNIKKSVKDSLSIEGRNFSSAFE